MARNHPLKFRQANDESLNVFRFEPGGIIEAANGNEILHSVAQTL